MRQAAFIQFVSKYMAIAIQLVITAVLARLISPSQFGLLAIVTVFSTFFLMFSDMGIGIAVVQFRDLAKKDLGSLFGFSIIVATGLTLLFCAASIPISVFYGDNELISLCCASSLALFFSTLNMVPNGVMLREKRFLSIGLRLVFATVVSGIIGIVLALRDFQCYALVVQIDVQAFIVFAWNLASSHLGDINFRFVSVLKRIFSYSAYQFGFSLINYFARNLDNLIIGKAFGEAALGFYDKAYKLTTYPLSAVSGIAGSVIQPFMAEHQSDPDRIFQCWKKVWKLLSLIAVPVAAIFISAPAQVIEIMYGPGWDSAIPLFFALSFSVYFQMINNTSGAFFQSLGRTDLMFRCGLVTTLMAIVGLIIGLIVGDISAVAISISVCYCLNIVPVAYYLVKRGFEKPFSSLLFLFPEISVGIVAILICSLISTMFPEGLIIQFCLRVLTVCSVILVGYVLTGQMKELIGSIRKSG